MFVAQKGEVKTIRVLVEERERESFFLLSFF